MGWQLSLMLSCLVSGALMIWLGTRKRKRKWGATSYDWRRDSQWQRFM